MIWITTSMVFLHTNYKIYSPFAHIPIYLRADTNAAQILMPPRYSCRPDTNVVKKHT